MPQTLNATVNLTSETFNRETSDGLAVVDFWAAWCGPCRILGPTVEELAGDLGDAAVVGKVDVDAEPELAGRYGVQSIPTVLFLRDGKEVVRSVGAVPKSVLLDHFETAKAA